MGTRVDGLLVAVVAVIVAAVMAVPIGSMQGMFGSSELAPVAGNETQALIVGSRSVDYRWYDMFNVPFGEWYDVRWDVYQSYQPLSDTYPFISKYNSWPLGNDKYYTNMRLDVTGRNMTELNMNSHPEFLPFLGSERGGTSTIDWYMQYLTSAEISERWPIISPHNDGWVVSLNGTTTMDKQAAMAVLNVSSTGFDDFANWWTAHQDEVEQGYSAWLLNEGNSRLDIYNAYEYPFTPLGFDLSAQKVGDKIVLSYDMISWGMEVLMTRWLHDAFMPTEWYCEDFKLDATIGPGMTDLHIGTAVEYAAYAWESVQSPGEPCWVWGGMLQDYIASSLRHPRSDFDPYITKTLLNKGPGNVWHGQFMPYDYTPGAWDLSEGEKLTFTWPSDVVQFKRHVGPGVVLNETDRMALSHPEPDDTDLPGNVAVYDSARMIVFTGPVDVWAWSRNQTAHMDLASEWGRLGVLPRGMPYLQFVEESTTPPSTTHLVTKGAQGPRASSVAWEYVPASYGVWTGHIVNNGLRSLTIDVYDNTTGVPEEIMHQRIRFSAYGAYPVGAVDTAGVVMGLNHRYTVVVTPSGPKGSSCTVNDVFVGNPPIAIPLIVSVDYLTVVVDGSLSQSDGMIVSYAWDFGDGSSATGITATHTYAAEGTYMITLTVTDTIGLTSSASQTVTVHSQQIQASFTYSVDGFTVNVNASSSSSAVEIVSYDWDWGDGTNGTGMIASHTYAPLISAPIASQDLAGKGRGPCCPHAIFGYTIDANGDPVNGAIVTVTNMRTGESVVWNETREYWDPNSNIYSVDLTELMLGHAIGDPLNVTATKGDLIGWTEAHVSDNGYTQIDVILSQMVGVKMVTITLTVTDMMGRSASVSHTVKLSLAPIAEFTLTMTGLTVIVDASSSTSAYGIVSYDWDWGDGTSGTGLTASHTYSLNGSMPASSELTTLGRSRPPPPHAVFGFTYQSDGVTPLPGCIVTVTNVRTGETLVWDENREYWDPNSNVYSLDLSWMVNYGFRIGDILNVTATKGAFIGCTIAPVTDSPNGYDQIDVVLYDSSLPHEFIITLTVTDTLGRNGSVSMQVMLDIPKLPIAIIHYATDYLNVTFDGGSSYDPDGTIVQYTWDFGDGSLATGWKAFHTYAARGTYTIKLTVVDNDGLIGTISSNVYVFSPPPPPGYAPTAVFSYTLYKNEISVDASESYDIDGEIVSYYWTIGDEASMLGETAYYRFSSGGTFVVTLIVTDNEGVSGSASTTPGAWSVVGVQEPDHVFLL